MSNVKSAVTRRRRRPRSQNSTRTNCACWDMVVKNLGLVWALVRRRWQYKVKDNTVIDLGDCVQAGCLGLFRAAKKFDKSYKVRFSTYAYYWINQSIQRMVQMEGFRAVQVPAYQYDEASSIINSAWGKGKINVDALYRRGKISKLTCKAMMAMTRPESLDSPVVSDGNGKHSDVTLGAVLLVDPPRIIDEIAQLELERVILKACNSLSDKERKVIERRYGLGKFNEETLDLISDDTGVTRECVRQRQNLGIKKLRRYFRLNTVEFYDLYPQ